MLCFRLFKFSALCLAAILTIAATVAGQGKVETEITPIRCWSYANGEMTAARLTADASQTYIGFEPASVAAIDSDGGKLWGSDFGGVISSNLLPTESAMFLVTSARDESGKVSDGVFRLLSRDTGITGWSLKVGDGERHFLSAYNGAVIVVSSNGSIIAVDPAGSVKWRREIADGFVSEPLFNGTKLLVGGRGKRIFQISMATGEIESMNKSMFGVTALGETWLGGQVTGDERGNVTSYANGSGKELWRFKTGGAISDVSNAGENLVVTSNDNFVYLIASRNGDVIWKKRLSGRAAYLAGIQNKYVIVAATDEHAATLTDIRTGKVAGQILLASDEVLVYDPVAVGDALLLLTNKSLFRYSLSTCPANKERGRDAKASPTAALK